MLYGKSSVLFQQERWLGFRTVSKLFADLLSQPSFIKKHLCHVDRGVKLLVLKAERERRLNSFLHYPLDNNVTYTPEVNYLPQEIAKSTDPVQLISSCNGLFCIVNFQTMLIALWNPTTREFSCLPPLPDYVKSGSDSYGFGYDSLNDDYKIICVICEFGWSTPILSNTSYIYSHRERCWKEIEQTQPLPPYCIQIPYAASYRYVHGKIHWIAYTCHENGDKNQFIVSLDLVTEIYGIVPQPPSDPSDDLEICAMGGELCFYINPGDGERGFEMWIMKEYGVEQSWFKFLTFPIQKVHGFCTIYVPLFMMKNGEILLQSEEHLGENLIYLYNPKTCNSTIVDREKIDVRSCGYVYVESLVETKHKDFLL